MTEFRMPSLGADMEAGTVIEWLVKPGDRVERGDVVAVVDTDKAEIDVEIWEAGVIDRLVVPEGERVPVGTVLAQITTAGVTSAGAATSSAPTAAPTAGPAAPVAAKGEVEPASRSEPARPQAALPHAERVRSTPIARRLAGEYGIDLARLHGTGPGGAVTRDDVEQAKGGAPEPRRDGVDLPRAKDRAASMRLAIGNAMARSKREIPHYYLETTIDLQPALRWLAETNRQLGVAQRVLPSALLLKATALALSEVPELNGHWVDGGFRPSEARHLGVAISLRGGGLLAPAVRDVDRKDLVALMQALRDLVNRTRSGKLRSSEVTDATLTVTSLGENGVEKVTGVIYPPQVALVGFGKIVERPWADAGMLGVRPVVTATLAADHRVSDGIRGAKFLNQLAHLLATPESL